MSQIHGSIVLEIPVERIAEIVALRVVAMLGYPAGSAEYRREQQTDPGAGPRRGHAGHGVVNQAGDDIDPSEEPGRWT